MKVSPVRVLGAPPLHPTGKRTGSQGAMGSAAWWELFEKLLGGDRSVDSDPAGLVTHCVSRGEVPSSPGLQHHHL